MNNETENEKFILFECNGEKHCSNSEGCYKNGGECYLTTDINYAANSKFGKDCEFYIELAYSNK